MAIDTTHKRYQENIQRWTTIEDITRVRNVDRYLIELNPQDKSKENRARNGQYRERAIFYAIASQTAQGMVGSIFRKWPKINVPSELEYLQDNADGAGNSIYQLSQGSCDDVLRKGRCGIAVSFPEIEGQVSRADMLEGRAVATIHRYEPEEVINWRVENDGAKQRLVLVVIREEVEQEGADYYHMEDTVQYREMYMDFQRDEEGNPTSERREVYRERIWQTGANRVLLMVSEHTPLDASGQEWTEIPFTFIGSENNDSDPDMAPFTGLVELNIGHYRNSADYEDSVWYVGQAQAWMSGITQEHIDLMSKNNMYVGSRNMLGVPSGEQFGFAQVMPNTMAKEAMDGKLEAMIQMGARLMQVGSSTKTATQASADQEATTSLLAMVASNVSEAYTKALSWCARFMGTQETELSYELSQEFVRLEADPQEIQQIVAGFIQGAVPVGDYVRYMRRKEIFSDDVSDEEYSETLILAGPMV